MSDEMENVAKACKMMGCISDGLVEI